MPRQGAPADAWLRRTGVRIAPSILSADFSRLAAEIERAEEGGADLIHLDVMDGHFVPNLTIGPAVVRAVRAVTDLPLDTHLMVTDPGAFIEPFREAGADLLSFHLEAARDPGEVADAIRASGARVGLAINPDTPLEPALDTLAMIDLLLVMTVHPGFGGQQFRSAVVPKVTAAARHKRLQGLDFAIEVDGGINIETVSEVVDAGAEILVAGSAVFGDGDPAANVRALREAAARAQARAG